jgi:hypothetical protein
MIGAIAIAIAVLAIIMLAMSRVMAEDLGIVVPDNKVYLGGGDPAYIYLTASVAVTPCDNVAPSSTSSVTRCKPCTAGSEAYLGTADLNDLAVLDDNTQMTHDWAIGEVVPIITGHCHVRKVADTNGVTTGMMVRIGSGDGAECENISTATARFGIGRAMTTGATTVAFAMNQT